MTRAEITLLREIGAGARGRFLSKAYFDHFPHQRARAKSLMWLGYIESGGDFGDCVKLTPSGRAALKEAEGRDV